MYKGSTSSCAYDTVPSAPNIGVLDFIFYDLYLIIPASLLSEWDINTRLEDGKLALNCIPFSVWQSNHKRCTVADRDRFLADLASAKTNDTSTVFVEQKKEALTRRTLVYKYLFL